MLASLLENGRREKRIYENNILFTIILLLQLLFQWIVLQKDYLFVKSVASPKCRLWMEAEPGHV